MNLVKWIRRNNTKVMAVVVILLLVGFIFQAFLTECRQRRMTRRETFAYFKDNGEITDYDFALAQRELETLRMLQVDVILRGIIIPIFQVRDLHAIMLATLLFPDKTATAMSFEHVKQMISANPYRINETQINDIYQHSMPSEIYWILLKSEARRAGVMISEETARAQLENAIPQLFNGATYSQVVGSVASRQGVSEKEILKAFGSVAEVLRYAELICSNENVTDAQIKHETSWEDETLNVEFVKFDSVVFAETADEPKEEKVAEHFEKYRSFFSGEVSDQNPYGFGYKLHDRLRLEYIALKLDDVEKTVTLPTQEEVEDFYQRHREEFIVSVPSDPNDPNSPPTERIRSYGEVANIISQSLLKSKVRAKAQTILQEARTLTETGLQDIDMEFEQISSEQFRKTAGDYKTVADQLGKKYKINVYTGQTALLSAPDFITDKHLGTLFVRGYGYNPVPLIEVAFAVDELKASELGPFDAPKPRLYENIGPAQDIIGQITMIVRVTEAHKASEPESINQTIAAGSIELGEEQQETSSIRDEVVKDLKEFAAMDTTKNKAEEFVKLAAKNGWENAVDKFNKLYDKPDKKAGEDPNAFKLQNLADVQRFSDKRLETLAMERQGTPTGWWLISETKIERMLIDQIYSLIPQDSNTPDTLPVVLEFKPDMSCYCLKNAVLSRLDQQQYNTVKAARVYREDFLQTQSVATVHFNPENIVKRMHFRPAGENETPADTNTPAGTEGDS